MCQRSRRPAGPCAVPAEVTLTRIDCGTGATPTDVGQRFTDTFAYKDLKLTFTFSCYLIKHGDEYMVWDTGFTPGTSPNAPKVGIVDRLKEVTVAPEQVKYVGISHFHGDHTGQLAPFTNATLLIGKGDWRPDHLANADAGRERRGIQELDQREQEGRAASHGGGDLDIGDVGDFLDDLVELRLAYEENGRYLALALPEAPR